MKDVRPTSSRVLLALFSILGGVEGLSFLDLFAGTGRVGLEALRRGAFPVVMAEVLKDRALAIERVIPKEHAERTSVLSFELRRAMTWLIRRGSVFDVVFADPPYNQGWGKTLLHTKNLEKILQRDGVLIVEHATREALDVPLTWAVTNTHTYGETMLSFFKVQV